MAQSYNAESALITKTDASGVEISSVSARVADGSLLDELSHYLVA